MMKALLRLFLVTLAFAGLSIGAARAQGTFKITKVGSFFRINSSPTDYSTVQSAIDFIQTYTNGAACTIQLGNGLLDQLNMGGGSSTLITFKGAWGNITLTGAANTTCTAARIILIEAVTVDCKAYIKSDASSGAVLTNNSNRTLTISNGGSITTTTGVAINNASTGAINITGGMVEATGSGGRAVINASTGTINVSGGEVSSTNWVAIDNSGAGAVNISAGTVKATTGIAVWNNSTGKITVSGSAMVTSANTGSPAYSSYMGTIHLENANATNEQLAITGGKVENTATGGRAVFNNTKGTVTVSGGTVTAVGAAVDNRSTGTVNVSNGTVEATTLYSIYNASSGTVNISGGTVKISASNASAVYNYDNGTVNISGGTIQATGANGKAVTNSAGALNISGNGTMQSDLLNNGKLTFNIASGYYTCEGVISGSGEVEKTGGGTLIFSGENTYNGLTTISRGSLRIGDDTNTGRVQGNIENNGSRLEFNRSNSYTYAGNISGSGAVYILSGSITLSGVNTYTGDTNVSNTNTSLTLSGSIANSSLYVYNASVTITEGNKTVKEIWVTQATLNLNNYTLTVGTLGQNNGIGSIFESAINGTGGIIKTGKGKFYIADVNTGAASLTLDQGEVYLGYGEGVPAPSSSWGGTFTQKSGTNLYVYGDVKVGGILTLQGGDIYMDLKNFSQPSKLTTDKAATVTGENKLHIETSNETNRTLIQAASGLNVSNFSVAESTLPTALSATADGKQLQLSAGTGIVAPTLTGTIDGARPVFTWTQNGVLHVSGLTAGSQWCIYSITGVLVYQGVAISDKAQIPLPARGIYIVREGNRIVKTIY